MKDIILVLMFLLLADVCSAQPRKSDRELAGLKGQVKEVRMEYFATETYDRNGDLIKTVTDQGNCQIIRTFTRGLFMKKLMKEQINDFSNSANCTRTRDDLPSENELIIYRLDYNDALTFWKDAKNFEWVRTETASVGKILMWRKTQYFDELSRLKEELYITRGLIDQTTIYRYEENKTEPFAAEFWTNNRFNSKHFYKYEYDATGNWIKRIVIKFEPASSVISPAEFKRTILYY